MKRSLTLDIIRALAVLLVLGHHMAICPRATNPGLYYLTTVWKRGGYLGVDLFFVLSGFLVSGLLFKEHRRYGTISFKNFLVRRGLKIYPSFYCLIAVTAAGSCIQGHAVDAARLVRELFFLQNYGGGLWIHTWSLAVEEHFYLLLPITLMALAHFAINRSGGPFDRLPLVFVFVATNCIGLRLMMARLAPYSDMTHLFPTHLRIDALLFGATLSYYYHYHSAAFAALTKRYRQQCLFLSVVGCAPAFAFDKETAPYLAAVALTLFYLASGLLLCALVDQELPIRFPVRAAAFLGARSYNIYLWHLPMAVWGVRAAHLAFGAYWNWYTYAAVYLVGSPLLGVLMSYAIEMPTLRVRDRLFPSRSQPATVLVGEGPSVLAESNARYTAAGASRR